MYIVGMWYVVVVYAVLLLLVFSIYMHTYLNISSLEQLFFFQNFHLYIYIYLPSYTADLPKRKSAAKMPGLFVPVARARVQIFGDFGDIQS